jgi:hypothetical protein
VGKKVIDVLATVASLHMEGCAMFVKLTNKLCLLDASWHYHAIMGIGTVAVGSQFPNIRRLALEKGLIPSADFGEGIGTEIENSWIVRAAAVTALAEVYQFYREVPQGLLAREVIQARKKKETHPIICTILQNSKCNIGQNKIYRRIGFLQKYTSLALADMYTDIQSNYHYMRKFIDQSDKSEKKKKGLVARMRKKRIEAIENETKLQLTAKGIMIEEKIEEKRHHSKELYSPEPTQVSTRNRAVEFSNLDHLILSTHPYHQETNRIRLPPREEDYLYTKLLEETILPLPELPHIGPSFIAAKSVSKYPSSFSQQDLGTANRRKMFHPPPKDQTKNVNAIKMPLVPPIIHGS